MKRKIICLFLGMLMLMTAMLTSCSTPEEVDDSGEDNSAKTIVMWVMTPDYESDEEAAAAQLAQEEVQAAFTAITKSKFKTNVVLKFVPEKVYMTELTNAINAERDTARTLEEAEEAWNEFIKGQESKSQDRLLQEFFAIEENKKYLDAGFKGVSEQDDAVVEEETIKGEYGVVEIKYPEPEKNQIDIFYLGNWIDGEGTEHYGKDKFFEYQNNGWLAGLNEELSLSSRKLTDYISGALLKGVEQNGIVYAIPNNVEIGSYTYGLIDKDLFDAYYNDIDLVDNVLDLERFLNDVKNYNEEQSKKAEEAGTEWTDVVPLASTFEECMDMLVWYWEMSYVDRTVYYNYFDEDSGRYYALGASYTVLVDKPVQDEQGNTTNEMEPVEEIRVVPYAKPGQLYKVNEKGRYVDKDGEELDYHYEIAEDVRFQIDGEKAKEYGVSEFYVTKVEIEGTAAQIAELQAQAGGMYLVDGEGNHITPENDKRVIQVNGEEDDAGKLVVPGGYDGEGNWQNATFDDDGNLVLIEAESIEVMRDGIETPMMQVSGGSADGPEYSVVRTTYRYLYNTDSKFSALGALYKDAETRSRGEIELSFTNLLADPAYQQIYTTLMNYDYNGYYGECQDGQMAAVSFIEGNAQIKYEYEQNGVYVKDGREYYLFVAEYPEVTDDALYGNMFAVYGYSNNLSRSMEVITCLNTNAELRNLLQYGIEGWHYEIDDDGYVVPLDSGVHDEACQAESAATGKACTKHHGAYKMDVERTGNCFIVSPTAEMGKDPWKYAKMQNADSLINPLLGFDFNEAMEGSEYNIDVELIDYINEVSELAYQQIDLCENKDELTATLDALKTEYNNNADAMFKKAVTHDYDPSEGKDIYNLDGSHSPFAMYKAWLNKYKYNVVVSGTKN